MGWRKSDLEPLRIRAWLRTGVVSDKWLPLDGVLLYQAHRQRYGAQESTAPGDSAISKHRTTMLPLAIAKQGQDNWYYKCSWAQWSHNAEGQDHWNKRFDASLADLIDFQGKRGVVIIEQNRYKAYHMPIFYRVAKWVEWYAVGNRAEIESLLSTLTHLGKKVAQGWGRVARWEIEPVADDWSVWRDGQLMRGIPAEDAAGTEQVFNLATYGIRPSYWRPANQKLLAMPG